MNFVIENFLMKFINNYSFVTFENYFYCFVNSYNLYYPIFEFME